MGNCEHCGKDFEPATSFHEKRFCDRRCKEKAAARRRIKRKAPVGSSLCPQCGDRFSSEYGRRYCSETCKRRAHKRRARERRPRRCRTCGGSVEKQKLLCRRCKERPQVFPPRECADSECGTVFEPLSRQARFCSEHRHRGHRPRKYPSLADRPSVKRKNQEANRRYGSPEYKRARRQALERDGHSCVRCGSKEDLQAHHRTPVLQGGGHTVENLETLCRSCHRVAERKLRVA